MNTSTRDISLPSPTHEALRGGPVLRWGLAGPGAIAHDWVSTVHANTDQRVVAVGSRDAGRAASFASRHGIERSHGSYAELFDDPGVDIVYIAVPHSEHARLAISALDAGKHVLVEKPIATSVHEAIQIQAAAQRAKRFAMEALWTRFLPQTTLVADLLADDAIGPVRFASADFGGRVSFDHKSRLFDPALGGGALLDMGVYASWFVHLALGPATTITTRGSLAPSGVDQHATIVTEHARGAHATATSSLIVNTPHRATIVGEGGMIEIEPPFWAPRGFSVTVGDRTAHWNDKSGLRGRDGLCYQATAVAAAVWQGRTEVAEHPLSTSLDVLRVIEHARRSLS